MRTIQDLIEDATATIASNPGKYHVGDTVKVISVTEVNLYIEMEDGREVKGLLFNYDMFEYCGKTFKIKNHWIFQGQDRYTLKNSDNDMDERGNWYFSNDMLISVNSELTDKLTPDMSYNEELL